MSENDNAQNNIQSSTAKNLTNADEKGGWSSKSIYILVMLLLVNALNLIDRNLFGLLIPLIKEDLQVSDTMLGLMSGAAFALFYGLAGVPIAYLADRLNRKKIIGIGLTLWSAATILTGFAQNAVQLLMTRFLLGIGEATGTAPSTSMIADVFGKRQRPLALSCFAAAGSLGVLIGFPILGRVANEHGWQITFMVSGAVGLVLAIIFLLTVYEPKRGSQEENPGESMAIMATLTSLIKSPGYVLLVCTSTLIAIMLSASTNWAPSFFMQVHDMNTAEVGALIGGVRGPAGIAGTILGGILTTTLARTNSRWLYRVPAIFMLCAFPSELLMIFAETPAMAMVGLGAETFFSMGQIGLVFALVMSVTNANTRAVAIAFLLLTMNIIGLSLGPLIVGAISDSVSSDNGLSYGLAITASSAIAAAIACMIAGRKVTEEEAEKEV